MRNGNSEIVIALAGQPNCGKSTIFNAVAGFKVDTGNFAGTTVSFTETRLNIAGRAVRLIDLPGTYSISSADQSEKVARDYLLSGRADAVVNVVDSSLLSRSLELTLQLIETGIPMVLCLNMHDEAGRKGIEIDRAKLSELTGLACIPAVAVRGEGLSELFNEAIRLADSPRDYRPVAPVYDRDVEECLASIAGSLPGGLAASLGTSNRFIAVRLLEADRDFESAAMKADPAFLERAVAARRRLAEMHGWPESGVFASHRHALVMDLYEMVAVHRSRGRRSLLERLDDLLINPFGGFLSVAAAFAVTMLLAFKTGDLLSDLISTPLETVETSIRQSGSGLWAAVLCGLFDGFVAGAGIVLPYLIPLLILMAVFEDTGFLPRIAFMVDGMLHRFGLHGKSAIPLMMGLGCTVPAVMSARNMENSRDRLLVMLVVPFIPCSARSMVILALAGKYLGAWAVILIYAAGVAMALMVSLLISKLSRRAEAGFIMDVPPLRRPYPSVLVKKVWFRLREFLVFAWPVILASSILLSLMNHAGVEAAVNRVLAPLTTTVLRLPEQTGITLFLGFFRKELTLAMLGTALGTMDVSSVLSGAQILVLVIFVTLYIPCLATVSVIWKEGGAKAAALSVLLGLAAATLAAGCLARAIV